MPLDRHEEEALTERITESLRSRYWLVPRHRWYSHLGTVVAVFVAALIAFGVVSYQGAAKALSEQGVQAQLRTIDEAARLLQPSEPLGILLKLNAELPKLRSNLHKVADSLAIILENHKVDGLAGNVTNQVQEARKETE